ncbi:MAG: hypothetical protein HY904_20510 [Deltaproteobacteria bacterium]|nr:hypothetical protein [Deltaproteobacteria bacterium]
MMRSPARVRAAALVLLLALPPACVDDTTTDRAAAARDLCHRFVAGYINYILAAEAAWVPQCPAVNLTEDEWIERWFGSREAAEANLCAVPNGALYLDAQLLLAAEAAGTVAHDSQQEQTCTAQARDLAGRQGRGAVLLAAAGDAGGALLAPCERAWSGRVPPGGACQYDIECAAHAQGVFCKDPRGESCTGTCVIRALPGEPCDNYWECTGDMACQSLDGGPHVCTPLVGMGETCGGFDLPYCARELECLRGACSGPLPLDADCSGTQDDPCDDLTYCDHASWTCVPRLGEGAACRDRDGLSGDDNCGPCLTCFPPRDQAGSTPRVCASSAPAGASCPDRPCQPGLLCIGGTCLGFARTGAACSHADNSPSNDFMSGNCLNTLDACQGNPPTCLPRVPADSPCEAPATEHSEQGTCAWPLTCRREQPSDVTGICKPPPAAGEPCGDFPHLDRWCAETGPELRCEADDPSWPGRCVAKPGARAPDGFPCASHEACASGLACHATADGGACGLQLEDGVACWSGGACRSGRCGWSADGGWTAVCATPLPEGADCYDDSDCGRQGACNWTQGHGYACSRLRALGESCDNDHYCDNEGDCVDGTCVAPLCDASYSCLNSGLVPWFLLFAVVLPMRRRGRGHAPT